MTEPLTEEQLQAITDWPGSTPSDVVQRIARELRELRKLCAEREEKLTFMAVRLGDAIGKRDEACAERDRFKGQVEAVTKRNVECRRMVDDARAEVERLTKRAEKHREKQHRVADHNNQLVVANGKLRKERDEAVRECESLRGAVADYRDAFETAKREHAVELIEARELYRGLEQAFPTLGDGWSAQHVIEMVEELRAERDEEVALRKERDKAEAIAEWLLAEKDWQYRGSLAQADDTIDAWIEREQKAREPFGTPTIERDADGEWAVTFPNGDRMYFGSNTSAPTLRACWIRGIAGKALLDHLEAESAKSDYDVDRVGDTMHIVKNGGEQIATLTRDQARLLAVMLADMAEDKPEAEAKPSLKDDLTRLLNYVANKQTANEPIHPADEERLREAFCRVSKAERAGAFDNLEASGE